MIAWPENVNYRPLGGTLQGEDFRAPLQTDMEDGPRRYRRATTKNIGTLQFTIRMTYAEFAVFKPWVRDTLVDGILPFTMPVWLGGEYENRPCQFTQPPRYANMTTDFVDVVIAVDVA